MYTKLAALTALCALGSAYQLPANLQNLYNNHKSATCRNILASGFSPGDTLDRSFAYCGDISGSIFLHSQSNGGQYADMDVDCDGANNSAGDCANDPSGQSQTAFQWEVQNYNVGISDLDANRHPYVVLGNSGASPSFDPQQFGVDPLSVVAVICNGQLHYGVWGDTNGGILVGESSISLAKLCFPNEGITGDSGHGAKDVMYIAFSGPNAVPGPNGANWNANSASQFEDSIKALGDSLVANL